MNPPPEAMEAPWRQWTQPSLFSRHPHGSKRVVQHGSEISKTMRLNEEGDGKGRFFVLSDPLSPIK